MKGTVRTFGDSVNTDEIIPARYLNTTDPDALAEHCMEDADAQFVDRAAEGDIIVAGENFGCGSSREHATIAIRAFGIQCVVAASFARIFFRNAVNIGLPIVECPGLADEAEEGQELEVDLEEGRIENLTTGRTYEFQPFGDQVRDIIDAGGLMPYTRQRLGLA